MDISSCTALVTGANRGLGRSFATELVKRGAKVYAGARNPDSVDIDGAIRARGRRHRPGVGGRRGASGGRRHPADQQRGHRGRRQSAHRRPRRRAPGDGDQLLRHAVHGAGVRSGHRGQRRRRHPQRALGAVLAELPGVQRVLRVEVRGVVDDQRRPRRTGRPRHRRDRAARRSDGHRHGGGLRRTQVGSRRRRRRSRSTPSRRAPTRSSPTTLSAVCRPASPREWQASTRNSRADPARPSGAPRWRAATGSTQRPGRRRWQSRPREVSAFEQCRRGRW